MEFGGGFYNWHKEREQKRHRLHRLPIGCFLVLVASYLILFSETPLALVHTKVAPPLPPPPPPRKADRHRRWPATQQLRHKVAFIAPLHTTSANSLEKEVDAQDRPIQLTSDDAPKVTSDGASQPDVEEKSQDRKMLEAAGLIYALNTLFKIALFTQFLEYGLSPFSRDMLAGAGGALVSILLLYSLDTLKTRQQLSVPLAEKQGLYRGWLYGVLRECLSSALYIAVFYAARNALMAHSLLPGIWVSLSAVVAATLLASIFRVPFEVMTKRVQAGMSSRKAALLTFKGQGKKLVFTPSWLAVEMRDIPYNVLQLVLFRYLQVPILWATQLFLPELLQRITCGLLAGAGAALATAPLDVAATRAILTDDTLGAPTPPLSGTLAQLRRALASAFTGQAPWLGNRLRMVYSALSTCIFFYVVETLRAAL